MTDDLIEQLAFQLAEIAGASDELRHVSRAVIREHGGMDDVIASGAEKVFKELARECLRQMEWAHWGHRAAITSAWGPYVKDSDPITLAPPEWKP